MKNPNPESIQVTKNLVPVLEQLAKKLFKKQGESPFISEEDTRKWIEETLKNILFPADLSSAIIKYKERKMNDSISGPLGDKSYATLYERQHYTATNLWLLQIINK